MTNYLRIASLEIPLDEQGYLQNLDDWNHDVAVALALQEQITPGPSHWEILNLLRAFYARHQLSPATRALVNLVRRDLGNDKGKSVYLMKLFGGSPARTASKIAGLPKPDNCL